MSQPLREGHPQVLHRFCYMQLQESVAILMMSLLLDSTGLEILWYSESAFRIGILQNKKTDIQQIIWDLIKVKDERIDPTDRVN